MDWSGIPYSAIIYYFTMDSFFTIIPCLGFYLFILLKVLINLTIHLGILIKLGFYISFCLE